MTKLVPLAAAAAALLAVRPAAPSLGASPGKNGAFVQARHGSRDDEEGGTSFRQFIRRSGTPGDSIVCKEDVPPDTPSACERRDIGYPAVGPDGRTIAFEDGGGISVERPGERLRRLGPFPRAVGAPAFSPDGRRLAVTSYENLSERSGAAVEIVSSTGGRLRRLTDGHAVDWSVRGWIAVLRARRLYRIRPDATGLRQLSRRRCRDASWAPDGLRTACASPEGLLTMAADGRELRRIPARRRDAPSVVVWSP